MLGVVTVTYNSASVLEDFMTSMVGQQDGDWRLYVIDNESRDETVARVRAHAAADARIVLVANEKNVGVAIGNNQGIRLALADGCDTVMLLNNDTVFSEDLFSGMHRAMADLQADMLIPKMRFFEPANRIWCAGGGFLPHRAMANVHFGEGEEDRGQYDTPRKIDYAPTCCMLIRRSVFDRIGLMDENFFVYADDAEFCLRAMRAGVTLWYNPTPVLHHKVSALTGGMSDFSIQHATYGRIYMIRKHLGGLAFWWLLLYQMVFLARFVMPGYGPKRFRLLRKAYRDAMAKAI